MDWQECLEILRDRIDPQDDEGGDAVRRMEELGRDYDRDQLRAEVERLRDVTRKAADLLDRHLGDSDMPDELDEIDDPVFHAHRGLVEALR